jgi:hypothetical protein
VEKNNLLHQCTTDKDWYIHAVTLYTTQDQKYRYKKYVVKELNKPKCNVFYVPNFQIKIRSYIDKFIFLSSKYSFTK